MVSKIRIDGIYDKRTLNFLEEKGNFHVAFDTRPKSLNYIQEYRLIDMLKGCNSRSITLIIDSFSKEMISRCIGEIGKVFSGTISLEVRGLLPFNLNELKTPFAVDYELFEGREDTFRGDYFKGYSIDYLYLDRLYHNGKFGDWIQKFFISNRDISLNMEVNIRMDWDSDIFPSLSEYFDFATYSLPIGDKVETCYRNADLRKIENNITFVKKHLSLS